MTASLEASAPLPSGMTWYRVTGDLAGGWVPLVVLHGGPGSTHDYLEAFADLACDGRAVVHYDQIGNGRSAPAGSRPPRAWSVDLFLDQLDELIGHLGIGDRYALLGHSWGGMLAAEHAVRRPAGLRGLVLADAPAAMDLWIAEAERLRRALPADIVDTLRRHEREGTLGHPDYRKATEAYYRRYLCRLEPWPADLARTAAAKAAYPTVYATMIGASDVHVTGTLRDWSIAERCHRIAVPTLLLSGRHDQATPATILPFAERIPDVRWVMLGHSSHMPHLEERRACMDAVGAFLAEIDRDDVGHERKGRDDVSREWTELAHIEQADGPRSFQRGQTRDHTLAYMGSLLTVLVSGRETEGALTAMVYLAEAGSEPPPHLHRAENEMFLVLEGELELFCEDAAGSRVAKPGELVFLPRGKAHAFRIRTERVRALILLQALDGTRTGEGYFRAMAAGPATSMDLSAGAAHYGTADEDLLARARRVGEENGIELLSPADVARRLPDFVATRVDVLPGGAVFAA